MKTKMMLKNWQAISFALVLMCSLTACHDGDPDCTITQPTNNQVIEKGTTFKITVDASDDDGTTFHKAGIKDVQIYIDNVFKTTLSAPYSYSWNTASESLGNHTILVKVTDTGKNTVEKSVTVIVNDVPVCNITSPLDNSTVLTNNAITITCTVTNTLGTITHVAYYWDGSQIGTATTSPHSLTYTPTSDGTHTLKAVATDSYSSSGDISISVISKTSNLVGTWESDNNYSGYDPLLAKTTTFKRRLYIKPDYTYVDSLRGMPSDQTYYNVYEMENGTWSVNSDETAITFTPALAKRMDVSNPTSLTTYTKSAHTDNVSLTSSNTQWPWIDTNLDPDVSYNMKKNTN